MWSAYILWGESLTDAMLQAQLRGMIGDFKGGDEMLLSQALEAFDTLTNTTTEYRAALEGKEAAKPVAGMSEASRLQPPSSNPFQVNLYFFHSLQDHTLHWAAKALGQVFGQRTQLCVHARPIPHAHSRQCAPCTVCMLPQKKTRPTLHPEA